MLTEKALAQTVEQLLPLIIPEPSEQAGLAAFEIPLGAEHGLGEHEDVVGDRAPA